MTITHIKDLTHDPKNARRHNPRNVGMLEKALNEVGAARSIVIDENGVILAGNATVEAAAQAGITRLHIVDEDGETLVAVRRRGLTPEQKTKLALYDNRVAELADWEPGVLAELAADLDLSSLFFPHELANLAQPGAGVDASELWKGMPEFEQEDASDKYKSLIVHFASPDDYEAFARLVNQALTPQSNFIWYPYRPTHGVPGSMQGFVVENEP